MRAQRHLLAASAYGKDVVDDQPGETPQVRMTFLHLGAPAQTTIPLNPGFLDSRFEYAAETVIGTVTSHGDSAAGRLGAVAL